MDEQRKLSNEKDKARERILILAALLALTGFLGLIQFSELNLFGVDGFYHIRMAQMYSEGWFSRSFPWLAHTDFALRFTNHHFLFHLLLAPFVWLSPGDQLLFGANLGSLVFALSAFAVLGITLYAFRVELSGLWLLAAATASPVFMARFLNPRAQTLALLAIFLIFLLMARKKYIWVAVVAFLFAWAYQLALVSILIGVVFSIAAVITERRFDHRPILSVAFGVILGFAINPFSPQSLEFLFMHVLFKVANPVGLIVGDEWIGVFPSDLFMHLLPWHFILISAWLMLLIRRFPVKAETIAASLVAVAFFLATWHTWRFIEYYPPLLVFALALSGRDVLDAWRDRGLSGGKILVYLGSAILILLTTYGLLSIGFYTPEQKTRGFDDMRLRGAANWLSKHSEKDTLVVNASWADFPFLFYHNRHNRYSNGLDPNLFLYHDPKRFAAYHNLSLAKDDHPAETLREILGGRYLLFRYGWVANRKIPLESWERLVYKSGLREVYHDHESIILEAPPR